MKDDDIKGKKCRLSDKYFEAFNLSKRRNVIGTVIGRGYDRDIIGVRFEGNKKVDRLFHEFIEIFDTPYHILEAKNISQQGAQC